MYCIPGSGSPASSSDSGSCPISSRNALIRCACTYMVNRSAASSCSIGCSGGGSRRRNPGGKSQSQAVRTRSTATGQYGVRRFLAFWRSASSSACARATWVSSCSSTSRSASYRSPLPEM